MADGSYTEFLKRKAKEFPPTGFEPPEVLHPALFDYQSDVVRWALRLGRAAMFLGTGMGKTLAQLVWAMFVVLHTKGRVIILAPLAVARQTEREALRWGIDGVKYLREDDGVTPIVVTNYDIADHFDMRVFVGMVADESSVFKSFTSKTLETLMGLFAKTPYKLCCTATPAPNDYTELGNHAEFLGVCTREEMLATFFVHDAAKTQDWRLKKHAQKDFWRWMASWSVMVRKPSDLGYSDASHTLPALHMHHHVVKAADGIARDAGILFASEATTLASQRQARRGSIGDRVTVARDLVLASPNEQWLLWVDLNDEGDAIQKAVTGCAQIAGADDNDVKEARILGFVEGDVRYLVTKPKIAGFGVNLQNCAHVAFVGLTHSFEVLYQSIRRCWRFGQKREVHVHLIVSEAELAVVENVKRKEADAERMATAMVEAMRETQWAAVKGTVRQTDAYNPTMPMRVPSWLQTERV